MQQRMRSYARGLPALAVYHLDHLCCPDPLSLPPLCFLQPTMAMIALKCPEIEVVVLDINEGAV